jgi:hypothetical protein
MSQHLQRSSNSIINISTSSNSIIELLDDPSEDSSSIFDLQAGHSSSTAAMRYGRTTFESQFMDRNLLKAFQAASLQWQNLLSVGPVLRDSISYMFLLHCQPSPPKPKTAASVPSQSATQNSSATTEPVTQSSSPESCTDIEAMVYTDRARPVELVTLEPSAKRIRTVCIVPSLTAKMSSDPPDLKYFRQAQQGLSSSSDIHRSKFCLGLVSRFPAAQGQWKCANQHSLVAHVLEGIRDVLAVLPTGAGKSMSFILPALVQTKVIIVIIPLVALKHDLARRLQAQHVSFCNWGPSLTPAGAPSVVLTSIESIDSLEYVTFVRSLQLHGRLQCIVVDEAHLFLGRFRYSAADSISSWSNSSLGL